MNSTNVNYLTATDVMNINHLVTEGDSGVRDLHLFESALKRPALVVFGEAQFPTLLDKAAALLHSLAYHHLFYDGNKRTAVQAVTLFLERNGYRFDYEVNRDYEFILRVAQGQVDVPEIAAWLGERTQER